MKILTWLCCAFIAISIAEKAEAQTGINSSGQGGNAALLSHSPIQGIVFTPVGIIRTENNGIVKSVQVEINPIVVKETPIVKQDLIETLSPLQIKYAMMIEVEVESLKNLDLLSYIEDWFGTPYLYGGESSNGIDCSALTQGLMLAVYGFNAPRTARQQYRATKHIKRKNLKVGDLVFFNTTGGVSHVGLYLGNDYFLQASSSQGVTISSLESHYFSRRFICGGRFPHEADSSTVTVMK